MSKGFSGAVGTRGSGRGAGSGGGSGGGGTGNSSKITVSEKAYTQRGDSDKHERRVTREKGKPRRNKGRQKQNQEGAR